MLAKGNQHSILGIEMALRKKITQALVLMVLILGNPVHSKYLPYSKIDSIFKKTWDSQYPVPYRAIKKKNTNGKGILVFRENRTTYYIYTFYIAMPSQKLIEKDLQALKSERILLAKLYYNPNNREKPYFIRLGELDEEFKRPGFIRYAK